MLASGAGHLLAGLERFPALAVTSAAGAVAFVIGVALLAAGHGLPGIALALVTQQSLMLLARLWALRGLIGRPRLAGTSEFAAMIRFSLPLQATALADLINQQSDKIVVALTASLVTVGQLGIGAQFADGGRLIASAALGPLISTLAVAAGARDRDLLIERFTPIHRLWVLGLLGVGLVGVGALDPLIEAWLGPGHHEAAVLGAILVLATVIGLTTGSGAAYLRAIGQPGLEARYGILVLCANTALTVPLAIVVGARGVVLGTLGAYLTGALWFYLPPRPRTSRSSPVRDGSRRPPPRSAWRSPPEPSRCSSAGSRSPRCPGGWRWCPRRGRARDARRLRRAGAAAAQVAAAKRCGDVKRFLLAFAVLLGAAVGLRLPGARPAARPRQALYAAIGQRLGIDTLPYRDLFDHKQPLIH